MIFNKKCGIGIIAVLVLCVIIGVLLGVLLPEDEPKDSSILAELPETSKWYGNEEIRLFRQYLSFPTMPPNIDYEPTVEFLKQQALSLDLPVSVFYPANEENPVVVMTWTGSDPTLPSIMLNSHMDVVPVFEEFWTHPPFAAEMDDNGKIFARGAQDTKATGMLYLAAIRAIKKKGIAQLRRTFHITFVPDEEMGGTFGMGAFVQTDDFKALNIGYALDDGMVSLDNQFIVVNDERCMRRIEFTCHGVTGHGSILLENTTGEKISHLIRKLMERRKIEFDNMKNLNLTSYANVTSINLTILKGGVQGNVIPPELSVTFDVRLSVNADHDEFERQINQWIIEAGGNITVNYLIKDAKAAMTRADESNPFWVILRITTRDLGLEVVPGVVFAATDMRYLRRLNIPAFGFLPLSNTLALAHDHDEYVNAVEHMAGINVYAQVISNLGQM